MDCLKCGETMEKGCISFAGWGRFGLDHHLNWYYDESIEKYSECPISLLVRPDIKFGSKRYKMGVYGLDAYLCERCGTMTVMPLPEDAENIEYYIKDFE